MADISHLGFKVDTKGLQKGEKALDSFASSGERAERKIDTAAKGTNKAMASMGRSSGQASIQFQQFIGQVDAGTSPLLAFSQQSADLGIVLGAPLLGAIAGISASLIGMLLPNLMKSTSSMKALEDAMASVNRVASNSNGILTFTEDLAKMAEKSEAAAKLMIMAAQQAAKDAGLAAATGISESFNDSFDVAFFDKSFDALKSIAGTAAGTGNSIASSYRKLGEQFGLTGSDAIKAGETILISLRKMEESVSNGLPNAGASIIAFKENLLALAETASGEQREKLLGYVNSISEYSTKAEKAAAVTAFLNESMNGAEIDAPTKKTLELVSAIDGVSASLEGQIIAMRDGEEAAMLYSIAQNLGLESSLAIPKVIREQVAEIERLRKAKEAVIATEKKARKKAATERKQAADLKALTNSVNNFGGAWSRTGNIIVDSFGSMSDAMGDYSQRMDELGKKEAEISIRRQDSKANQAELDALQMQINSERVSAELSGLSALSSATGAMFGEKTKAAKAFAALNKVIAITEIAMSFKKMAAGTAETGVHVANETTKQSANALTAITGAFAAPFPVGFIAGAAMIGVMASLLGSSKSGGNFTDPTESRQDSQGTGSMLGSDDKSSSILDSQERFEDIQLSQLSELRGIRSSMTNLANGIAQVTKGLMASSGFGEYSGNLSKTGFADSKMGKQMQRDAIALGDFSGVSQKVINSIFGTTKTKVTDTGIKFVATSLSDILDGGIVDAQQYFDVTKTKKKLFGLVKKTSTSTSLEGIDSDFGVQVGAIFQDIGSVISESASLLGFDVESALNAFQVDLGSISLEGLSGSEIEEQLQAIFSRQADLITGAALPDLKEFQEVGEGLFETLSRVTQEQMVFNDVTRSMGMNLSELSSILQIEVAQSVIELTGGLERFSELSNAFVDKFYSDAEKFAMLESDLVSVFSSVGQGMVTTKEDFRALVEGLDLTNEAQREVYATLLEVSPAFDEYIKGLEKVQEGLEDAVLNSFGKLEQAIKLQKNSAQAALDVAQEAHNAELDRIESLRNTLEAENELRTGNLATAEEALNNSFNAEIVRINEKAAAEIEAANAASQAQINGINEASKIRISGLNNEKSVISKTASSMRSLVSAINGTMKSLAGGGDLTGALQAARGGDLSQAKELDIKSLAKLDASNFLSAEDLQVQEAINQNQLKEIGDIAGTQLSHAERQLLGIENQVAATKNSAAAQIEAVQAATEQEVNAIQLNADNDAKALQDQLNALLGIDTTNLSMADATVKYQEAKMALDAVNYAAELAKLDMLETSANDVYLLHQEAYTKEIERLDGILASNQLIVDAALGIDSSVMSVASAVSGLNGAISSLAASNAAAQRVPENPVKETATHFKHTSNEVIVDELRAIDKKNSEIQMQMLRNSQVQASALQEFKLNGLDTRNID